MKGDLTFMKKKIYAICALLLAFAMLFSFAACDAGTTDEDEETTVTAKTEAPESKEAMVEYFNRLINSVKAAKPGMKKSQSQENVSDFICGVEDGERNSTFEKAVPTLKKYILKGVKDTFEESRNAETEYGSDINGIFPIAGQDWSSKLTAAEVSEATLEANDDNSQRTLTIIINEPSADTVAKAFNPLSAENREKAVEEFRTKLKGYISFTDIESMTYTECKIICVINTEDDTIASVEYVTSEKITTTITGEGTLAELGTLPCSFVYTYGEKYELDWVDPSATTTEAE